MFLSPICVIFSQLLTSQRFGSPLLHSSRGLLWILKPLNALWRIFCLIVSLLTQLQQHKAPGGHKCVLQMYVAKLFLVASNRSWRQTALWSINTWSQEGKEAFPGLTSWDSITGQFTTSCRDGEDPVEPSCPICACMKCLALYMIRFEAF